MLPSLRSLIAAMLATVVVLICGFGIFAAFRVSRDPIAHLPAAAAPLQLVGETTADSSALVAAHESTDRHSQFDVPIGTSGGIVPAATEQDTAAELADDAPATPGRTKEAELSAASDLERQSDETAPPEPPPAPPGAPSQAAMPLPNGDRPGDAVADLEDDFSPRPVEQSAEPSAADKTITATMAVTTAAAEDAPGSEASMPETEPGKTIAALNPEAAPAAAAPIEAKTKPDEVTARRGPDTRPKPPLLPAVRVVSRAPPVVTREEPRRVERPIRRLSTAVAAKPKRLRVAIARTVRAVRFTGPYYAQYAQGAAQTYGYGETSVQGASESQQQIVVRLAVRPRAARPAVGKVNSAMGGPFVRARNP